MLTEPFLIQAELEWRRSFIPSKQIDEERWAKSELDEESLTKGDEISTKQGGKEK